MYKPSQSHQKFLDILTEKNRPKKVASLMDEYLGDQKEYQKAVDDGFQGTYEEFLRMKSLERKELAIGGGVIQGKDYGTREGFDEPYAVQKISKLGGEPFERVYTKKPGKKTVYDVDEEALKNEWRKTLTKKDPVPWKNFLEKKFPKGAEAIRKRIEAKKNFFPAEEFSVVKDKKRQDRLAKIKRLKEAHQKSDKFLYDAKSVAKKLKINLTRKDHAAELDLIDTFDSRGDKIRKAFDKITLGNMKLYKPKRTASGNITAMNPVYKIISDMVSNPELSARYSTDARIINKALENHQPYLDIKDDFDYFAQNESSNFIGQNFKDGLEYAKYKRGGLDIKNTGNFSKVYALPEKNILEFAIRNAYVNFKRGNAVDPKEAVELFYLNKNGKKGKPVDFNALPKDKKSRARILNSDKVGFTYKGEFYNKKNVRTKGYKSDGSGVFNEVYEMSQKGRTLVPDPNSSTGEQISLKQLLGDTGDRLTIGHNDAKGGVAGSPFNDLRLEGAKFNASIFQAYDKVKDPKAREIIINNLQGKFKDLSGPKYEKLFIESKRQLAEDVFNNPEKVAKLPTYYRGAGQKVLADMGKTFFDESDDFKREVSRVADIDLEEYEANKSKYKKNLVSQIANKNNIPPEMVEEYLKQIASKGGAKGKAAVRALQILVAGGLGYNMEDILKGTGLVDKEYELTASVADAPLVEKGLNTGEKVAAGTTAGLGIGTKIGRKALGTLFNLATGPTGMIGLNYAFKPEDGYDLSRTGDRLGFELEAALAPTLVKGVTSVSEKVKNPLVRKGIETLAGVRIPGIMKPTTALKLARLASPVGIALLAGEGVYKLGKLGYEDQKRFDALSPEEQEAERAEQEAFAFDITGA